MCQMNAFGQCGKTIDDPDYKIRLVKPKGGAVFGGHGRPSESEAVDMMEWLIKQHMGFGHDAAVRWCERHDPRVEVTLLRGQPAVVTVRYKEGAQPLQSEFSFLRQLEGAYA